MNKETLNPYRAHEKRIAFIQRTVEEGVLDKILTSERNQNIGLVYYLNEELTGSDIAKIYPKPSGNFLTRARISSVGEKFLKECYENASSELQACHPLEELLERKLPALEPTTLAIKRNIAKGIKPNDIKVSNSTLHKARETLGKRGIKVGIKTSLIQLRLDLETKVANAGEDDEKLQKILNSFSAKSLKKYFDYHNKADRHKVDRQRILISFSKVLRQGGFRFHNKSLAHFAAEIRVRNIPLRSLDLTRARGKYRQRYYFVYNQHAQRIIEALRNNPYWDSSRQ